ncbi:hypothetical protein MWU61_11055 [Loktanella sp. F6476L]|uniref:hypothetical protein n=1 Tax=Loktanella sp. F6476L TaxID=2926405 RepID=UPI001FF50831|nr:hypothetical protein [Loktanella sp. F6476L]MCK0121079.1 hypothetical protein [Loktanella sp. F6476L]
MTTRNRTTHIGTAAIASGLIGAFIYLVMINVTLAQIEAVSGYIPFDMRPFGYDHTDAAHLLDGLGPDGRHYYLTRQIPLDTVYPAVLTATLIATIIWLGRRIANDGLIRFGIILSVACALFDYAENLGIVAMIWGWPDVSTTLVFATSSATVLKSIATTMAVCVVLTIGGIAGLSRKPKFL